MSYITIANQNNSKNEVYSRHENSNQMSFYEDKYSLEINFHNRTANMNTAQKNLFCVVPSDFLVFVWSL